MDSDEIDDLILFLFRDLDGHCPTLCESWWYSGEELNLLRELYRNPALTVELPEHEVT